MAALEIRLTAGPKADSFTLGEFDEQDIASFYVCLPAGALIRKSLASAKLHRQLYISSPLVGED